jgi:hypothetical protein
LTSSRRTPTSREWAFGAAKFALGVALFLGATRIKSLQAPYLIGWIGMVGIVLMLHFGLFHLLSCAWRHIGVDARPLMDWPLKSTSLSEFWGRRWNTAFRDLLTVFVSPADAVCRPRGASSADSSSAALSDVVISMPSRGSYGGPTLFFPFKQPACSSNTCVETLSWAATGTGGSLLVAWWRRSAGNHPPFVEGIWPLHEGSADGL